MSPPVLTNPTLLQCSLHEFKFVSTQQYSCVFSPCGDRFTVHDVPGLFQRATQELQSDFDLLLAGSSSVQQVVRLGNPCVIAALGKHTLCKLSRLLINEIVVHEI